MVDTWVSAVAQEIAARAEGELAALVNVSSPSGDIAGGERAVKICGSLLPAEASVQRLPCSTPDHAEDMLATLRGSGVGRLLLLGHLDTVHAHADHRPFERVGDHLVGPGTADMKGGVVLALGVMRALAEVRDRFAEVALLLVLDEEWRERALVHTARFEGFDACLCFEAGERSESGEEGVVVRRKAAGTLRVRASGQSAHSGANPDGGRNALVALAGVARMMAGHHDPGGPQRLTSVPTVMRSGEAFNVVPGDGELFCDLRADTLDAFAPVLSSVPARFETVDMEGGLVRRWPGMDSRVATEPLLAAAGELLGARIVARERGGASDASYLATVIPLTVDGLGPIGGGAHTPQEYVLADSLWPRAAIALALVAAALNAA